MQKEEIIEAIKRTARENEGRPLGRDRFEEITGINAYTWQKFWPRFSELQRESGFEPNQMNRAYDDSYLIEKIIGLIRKLDKYPTTDDRKFESHNNPDFPNSKTFDRLGNRNQLILKVFTYCQDKPDYNDIKTLIHPLVGNADNKTSNDQETVRYGFVYMIKGHPGEYKIGRTNLVDRRLSELGTTAAIDQELVHEIKTDDPVGIESYWHKRFQQKRMRGEWFKLSVADVKMFKRWKRIG